MDIGNLLSFFFFFVLGPVPARKLINTDPRLKINRSLYSLNLNVILTGKETVGKSKLRDKNLLEESSLIS